MQAAEIIHAEALVGPRHQRELVLQEFDGLKVSASERSSRYLQLDLTTQAGTYVKEFVHGDFGRTHPNLGSLLGCSADILQLDVMGLKDGHA